MSGNAAYATKAKVLLVQSAQTQGNGTRRHLEHSGYDVIWAGSGISALMIARNQPVDVILLDFALPDIEGSDLCRRFRSRDDSRDIPIILLTARGSVPESFVRLQSGPDDYLAKPYTERELDSRINAVLQARNASKAMRLERPASPAQPSKEQSVDPSSLPPAVPKSTAQSRHSPADRGLLQSVPERGEARADQVSTRSLPDPRLSDQPAGQGTGAPPPGQRLHAVPPVPAVKRVAPVPPDTHQTAPPPAQPVGQAASRGNVPASQQSKPSGHAGSAAGNISPAGLLSDASAVSASDEVIDAATGLFSRRQFEAMFSKEFKRSVRFKQQLSCMMIDLDGRAMGRTADAALIKAIMTLVQQTIREVDTAAVWTGDAFIVLLPNTIRNDAVQAGMRVLEAVAGHPFSWPDSTRVTMSIGVAGLPDRNIDSEQKMIDAAKNACDRAREWTSPGQQGPDPSLSD